MLVEERYKLADIDNSDLLEIADFLCHQCPIVRPVFECVKVYVRLHESGRFTHARHPLDLGTSVVSARDIAERMKTKNRELIVLSALTEVEKTCTDIWPFSAGSSSWVLLEILHPEIRMAGSSNTPMVIFRKAVRLNSRGQQVTTPLLERMFEKLKGDLDSGELGEDFRLIPDPVIKLSNISGAGVFADFQEQVRGMMHLAEGKSFSSAPGLSSYSREVIEDFIDGILENNFAIPLASNPGFYFKFKESTYSIRSDQFLTEKKQQKKVDLPPLPISGLLK